MTAPALLPPNPEVSDEKLWEQFFIEADLVNGTSGNVIDDMHQAFAAGLAAARFHAPADAAEIARLREEVASMRALISRDITEIAALRAELSALRGETGGAGDVPTDPCERCDDREVMNAWRAAGLPEYFLGNGGTNHALLRFANAWGRRTGARPVTS